MPFPDAITAVASGWARSERALIRLSGEGMRPLAQQLFDNPAAWPTPADAPVVSTPRFMLTPSLGVRCVTIAYAAPKSYTGEDGLELVVPGSPPLLERVVARLCAEPGVREAGPGEFSARAFLAGKMTLAQAEGVAATIAAGTEAELGAAAELSSGRAGARARAWADACATLLALVEAGIDFTDQEDVVPIAPAALRQRVAGLLAEIQAHLGARAGEEQRGAEPVVVLAGEPNAGKSTLFNALLGRRRSVESPVAGTTRDVIAEPLDLSRDGGVEAGGTGAVTLVDMAGLDASAAGEIDAGAQRAAREAVERADVVVWCDPSGRFRGTLRTRPNATIIRVRTKADLVRGNGESGGEGESPEALAVCALDRWNLGSLRRAIADAAWGGASASAARGGSWMLPRHRRTLTAAARHLRSALDGLPADAAHALPTPELTASGLRAALDALGELAGAVTPDDVIGRVFATFCVGK